MIKHNIKNFPYVSLLFTLIARYCMLTNYKFNNNNYIQSKFIFSDNNLTTFFDNFFQLIGVNTMLDNKRALRSLILTFILLSMIEIMLGSKTTFYFIISIIIFFNLNRTYNSVIKTSNEYIYRPNKFIYITSMGYLLTFFILLNLYNKNIIIPFILFISLISFGRSLLIEEYHILKKQDNIKINNDNDIKFNSTLGLFIFFIFGILYSMFTNYKK